MRCRGCEREGEVRWGGYEREGEVRWGGVRGRVR